ncbi:hypothetical protein Plhal304r1_c091g0171851 [Plasmopara halstedii]
MPFYGMFDNVLNHLTLPTLQLNSGMLKIGNAVEVSNGVKTFLGTILSLNEMDQTYTIQYEDGRKEKSVSKDRVRVSLRRLQIGTEVEMIVEGPYGKPAFTAPLSSTWLELYGYYCNFGIEMEFMVGFLGLLREFDDMVNVYQETSSEFLENIQHMTVIIILVMLNGKSVGCIIARLQTLVCVYLVLSCIRSKVSALQDDYCYGVHFGGYIFDTCDYASFLNRFDRYCLLTDTHLSFDELAFRIDPFALHIEYISPVQRLLNLGAMTTFNLFRGVTFYVLLFAFPTSGTNFLRVLCFWSHQFYLRRYYYRSCSVFIGSFSLVIIQGIIDSCTGRFSEIRLERHRTSRNVISDEVLNLAERGEFGLQAQREALVTKVEQRQDELGIWKLTILRIHRHLLKEDESSVVQNALAFHLALSITWLLISLITGVCALTVRQQMPELLAAASVEHTRYDENKFLQSMAILESIGDDAEKFSKLKAIWTDNVSVVSARNNEMEESTNQEDKVDNKEREDDVINDHHIQEVHTFTEMESSHTKELKVTPRIPSTTICITTLPSMNVSNELQNENDQKEI